MSQPGQISPDGMWQWDGTQWKPTEKQTVLPGTEQPLEAVLEAQTPAVIVGEQQVDKRAAKAAAKQQAAAEKDIARRQAALEREAGEFAASPVGRARAAFERGDEVYQYSIDVMSQQAVIVMMVGSATAKRTSDPSDVLNAVCCEGWELVNGSFVFVEEGQQSRDKFLSSGQNVAVKGTTFGYYLFRRKPALRSESSSR
ncbi:MAG: hypothetical protein ACR2LE_03715 [Nocardioidaceae bacterium]